MVEFNSDDQRVGQVAAQHLIEKGYREFAFVGSDFFWSVRRAAGFKAEVERAGYRCSLLQQEAESTAVGRGCVSFRHPP
jgi:LacI family transcriptional regulator